MHPKQRQDALLLLIAKHGFLSVRELAEQLQVSEMTIRRDLRVLEEKGLVDSVTGGVEVSRSANEPSFHAKRLLQQAEKWAIAKAALKWIEPNMTVGFSAGTTTWMLANRMTGFRDLTFVTNSTNIALELSQRGWSNIILSGGYFRTPSDALVGPLAERSLRMLHVDVLFLGVHGLDVGQGLTTPNLSEAAVDRLFMERASKVIVLCDHTKWGIRALAHIANLDEVDLVITDDGVSSHAVRALSDHGIEVVIAPCEELPKAMKFSEERRDR
ncbi:DeoR/GlpR family DNA-binding transcription regulator [Sulfoacidibacillus thermotolerans]|uniref:DeoR/GlpR family DNA-binding transcription regulator n=1 Tax=Sulfoacidibacillus thermotolerans TaxID=1765684 RepID=UPI0024828C76|nr:DeoR/GlpR family DNA-binding transcription regulator [Sulfoacidibacillus thermotolerans]